MCVRVANKVLPVQMLGHSCRCLTKGNIISATHYLPRQAHRLVHLFLCWGEHKRPLSRAVIYQRCIRGTWSYLYLAGVACISFWGCLFAVLGFFPTF